MGHALATVTRSVQSLFETLQQHFGEDPYLPCGMLTWRADDIYACRKWWMACHNRNERAGGHIFMGDAIRDSGDAESCQCCSPRSNPNGSKKYLHLSLMEIAVGLASDQLID